MEEDSPSLTNSSDPFAQEPRKPVRQKQVEVEKTEGTGIQGKGPHLAKISQTVEKKLLSLFWLMTEWIPKLSVEAREMGNYRNQRK